MVNVQNEFNNKFSKTEKEIEFKRKNFQEQQLVIEDYLELESLYLINNKNVDKIVLRNLKQLEKCEIFNCGMKDLVIENCPRIKKLDIQNNYLTNLEFLVNLESLEELELDGNTKLTELLKPYKSENDKDGWKTYQKDLQEIFKLVKQNNPQKLAKKFWDLKKSREDLKKDVSILLSKEIHQKTTSKPIKTTELILNLGKEFQEKEAKINYLESRVQELVELSKQQKEKIISAFAYFFSEKELLQELIKIHLEFTKLKRKGLLSVKLRRQRDDLQCKLEDKLGDNEEMAEKLQLLLTDCEKLFEQELEKETKLNNSKSLLIEGKKEILSKEPNSEEKEERILELEKKLAKIEKQLEDFHKQPMTQQIVNNIFHVGGDAHFNNQIIYQIQYNLQQSQQALTELKQRYQELEPVNSPPSNPQNLKKTILFLAAKKTFAETRQNTINNLIDIYNETDKSGKKFEKVKKTGDTIKEAGWIFPGAEATVRIVGKGISLSANFFKQHFLNEHSQNFEDYLIGDEKAIELLKETYQTLENSFQDSQSKLSTIASILKLDQNQPQLDQHSIFKIGDLKPNENLTVDKMSQVIEVLNKHLETFIQALQQEASQCDQEIKLLAETNGELPNEIERLLKELIGEGEQSQQQNQIEISPKN